MTWFRMPLFVWSHYATSLILVLATPVFAIVLLLDAAERMLDLGVFDPASAGSHYMDTALGTINTAVLILSSFTVARNAPRCDRHRGRQGNPRRTLLHAPPDAAIHDVRLTPSAGI